MQINAKSIISPLQDIFNTELINQTRFMSDILTITLAIVQALRLYILTFQRLVLNMYMRRALSGLTFINDIIRRSRVADVPYQCDQMPHDGRNCASPIAQMPRGASDCV